MAGVCGGWWLQQILLIPLGYLCMPSNSNHCYIQEFERRNNFLFKFILCSNEEIAVMTLGI